MASQGPVKITAVGDGFVGKTCLLITYTQNEFPELYLPPTFENFGCKLTVGRQTYNLTLLDTAGQEGYDRIRPLSYHSTDCFLICYSISNRASFENAASRWWPEIRIFSSTVPIILVGTKSDLRIPKSQEFVTRAEGENLKKKIGAHAFVECSARGKLNLQEIFIQAIRAVERKKKEANEQKCCQIL